MKEKVTYQEAQELILNAVTPVGEEKVPLETSFRRVLAGDLIAAENVPAFDRSPYDGYAFRADDTKEASPEHPVTFLCWRIIRHLNPIQHRNPDFLPQHPRLETTA